MLKHANLSGIEYHVPLNHDSGLTSFNSYVRVNYDKHLMQLFTAWCPS